MLGKRVSDAAAWVTAACLSISLLAMGIYINSASTLSISCVKCEESHCSYGVCKLTENFCLWAVIVKQEWEILASYLILFILGSCAIILVVERVLKFNAANRETREFQRRMEGSCFCGQLGVAAQVALEYPLSPLAFVVNASLDDRNNGGKNRPEMSLRQPAIVAKTFELKRGLWQLSAIGYSLGLLVLLFFCSGAITAGEMMRYDLSFFASYIGRVLNDSLHLIVYCTLVGFVVLVAHKFLTARVEQFQLEMDRLSLAFIERITSRTSALDAPDSYRIGIIPAKKTAELLEPARCCE